ncbi:MAG: dihydrolipoyl dehydrogenase [bacterium]|nr:dihydrolipoyl dehydrogenase [bacterium]
MSSKQRTLKVPSLGGIDEVEVIEVLVSKGDHIHQEDPLITLESDKAAMDIPAEADGEVAEVLVKTGDWVREGDPILKLILSAAKDIGDPPQEEGKGEELKEEDQDHKKAEASAGSKAETQRVPVSGGDAVDLLVLGGGPGGYTAAFRAADLGLKVVLVEERPKLGGVCLNVGCIPTKALLHAARSIDQAAQAAKIGLNFGAPEVDFAQLQEWKQSVVSRLVEGLGGLAKQRKVRVIQGRGRFVGERELEVKTQSGTERVAFKKALLATGSRPVRLPHLPQSEHILDSTGALALKEIPRRLLIIGGGVIGLEFSNIYTDLGSKVYLVEMAEQLLPGLDPDLARSLKKALKPKLEGLYLKTSLESLQETSGHLEAMFKGQDQPLEIDKALVAVGRKPNSGDLGLELLGLKPNDQGLIEVDRQMRTEAADIWAIGDLVPGPQLAHKAMAEGKLAAEVIAGKQAAWDHRVIPAVAYTEPEVAWVGLSEAQAKEQGLPIETQVFPWKACGRALAEQAEEGLTKLIFHQETKRLLGAALFGRQVGDLIGELALAIEMDCQAGDLALSIHPHPTFAETLPLAAEMFERSITDLMPPKD